MTVGQESLYSTLGEEVGIRKVVEDFYERVLGDSDLAPKFENVDLPALRRHQVAMISAAAGGPNQYTGREMRAAHAGLNITGAQFDKVVGHLVASLGSFGVSSDAIGQVGAALAPLKSDIVSA
ncbi:MAG: group 1 truncated hemoglobin [bacterium]